jgi:hypothetical protein
MLRIIVLLIVAYFAYRYVGWPGPVGVIAAYAILVVVLNAINANRARHQTHHMLGQKLSDDEKAHLASVREHQQVMHDHKAQFDPELRKSRP